MFYLATEKLFFTAPTSHPHLLSYPHPPVIERYFPRIVGYPMSTSSDPPPPIRVQLRSSDYPTNLCVRRSSGVAQWLRVELLAILNRRPSVTIVPPKHAKYVPYLPLRHLQLHVSTSLGSEAMLLLKTPANDPGGDRKVSVVAVIQSRQLPVVNNARMWGPSHVNPAAFQAATILTDEVNDDF